MRSSKDSKYLRQDRLNYVEMQTVLFEIETIINYRPLISQPAITCSNLTIETLEQRVKYV